MRFLLAIFVAILIAGCAGTPTQNAIKVSGGVVVSVDAGMKLWSTYVNEGHATQAQVDAVENAYNAYYAAALADKAALTYAVGTTNVVDITAVSQSLAAAESALTGLLNQYLPQQ
jgi:hypothetical protein